MLKVSSVDHGNEISAFAVDNELCCLATNGQLVLGGDISGGLVVFDLVQGCELACHNKHTDAIRTIVLSPTSQHVVTSGDDNVRLHFVPSTCV